MRGNGHHPVEKCSFDLHESVRVQRGASCCLRRRCDFQCNTSQITGCSKMFFPPSDICSFVDFTPNLHNRLFFKVHAQMNLSKFIMENHHMCPDKMNNFAKMWKWHVCMCHFYQTVTHLFFTFVVNSFPCHIIKLLPFPASHPALHFASNPVPSSHSARQTRQ